MYRKGLIQSHAIEYRVMHKDGTIRWIYDKGVVTRYARDGMLLKVVGTHADITQRKELEKKLQESEKRFSDLAKNLPGVIYQWQEGYDGSFSFTYVSPKLKDYFDIDPASMNKIIDYVHPDDVEEWRRSIEEANITGAPWRYEGRLLYPCGKIKWWRGQSSIAERNAQGIVYNCIMTDITDEINLRAGLEEKKEAVKKQLLQAVIKAQEKERELIAYELHDNVNQVLATTKLIIGLVDVHNSATFSFIGQGKDNIDMAMEEIRSISHGLNASILTMTGLPATVNGMLQKIQLGGKLVFSCNYSAEAILALENRPEAELAFFRIIQAQAGNILKHSRATKAGITLEKNGAGIQLSINDNGIGFNANNICKGLGLVNIFDRAELFNGSVTLITQPGQGCSLSVLIPVE